MFPTTTRSKFPPWSISPFANSRGWCITSIVLVTHQSNYGTFSPVTHFCPGDLNINHHQFWHFSISTAVASDFEVHAPLSSPIFHIGQDNVFVVAHSRISDLFADFYTRYATLRLSRPNTSLDYFETQCFFAPTTHQ